MSTATPPTIGGVSVDDLRARLDALDLTDRTRRDLDHALASMARIERLMADADRQRDEARADNDRARHTLADVLDHCFPNGWPHGDHIAQVWQDATRQARRSA